MPRFRIGAVIKSTNKPAKGANVWVEAKNKEEAEGKGKRKIQKDNPNGHVDVSKVEEVTPPPEPPKSRWW